MEPIQFSKKEEKPLAKLNPTRTYKVLVVDDEPDARELFVDIIGTKDYLEVSTAVDGVEALAKSEATKFDLILLDIIMPKKDGVQTLKELVASPEKYGTPRVLMLTNIGGDLAIEEALSIGAVGYRVKIDTEPDKLLATVDDELAKLEGQAPESATTPATAQQPMQVNDEPKPDTPEEATE